MVLIDDAFLEKLRESLNDASPESEASSLDASYWGIDRGEQASCDTFSDVDTDACPYIGTSFSSCVPSRSRGLSQQKIKNEEESSEEDLKAQAFAKLVRLVNVRERCAYELKQRLVRDGFDRDIAYSCVQRACDCGLVDDLRFADVFIRSKISQGKGKAGIVRDLKMYGIDVYDVDGWPDRYFSQDSYDAEFDRALALLLRKPPHSKNLIRSAYQKLISRGYDSGVAQAAAKEFARQIESVHV